MKFRAASSLVAFCAVLSNAISVQPNVKLALLGNNSSKPRVKSGRTALVKAGMKVDSACQARKDAFKAAFDKVAISEAEDPCRNGKEHCVIALSLYCPNNKCNPFYSDGVERNIKFAKANYPGWKIRLYTDGSVTPDVKKKINAPNVEEVVLKQMAGQGPISGMFWRLFATHDPKVDRIMIRDIDSVLNLREKSTVNEWIRSGKKWHIIKDHYYHTAWPIVGGCWGVMRKPGEKVAIPADKIEIPVRAGKLSSYMQSKGGDQDFLRDAIFPMVGSDLCEHTSYWCHPGSRPVPVPRRGSHDTICYPNQYKEEDELYECNMTQQERDARMASAMVQKSPPECRFNQAFGEY